MWLREKAPGGQAGVPRPASTSALTSSVRWSSQCSHWDSPSLLSTRGSSSGSCLGSRTALAAGPPGGAGYETASAAREIGRAHV